MLAFSPQMRKICIMTLLIRALRREFGQNFVEVTLKSCFRFRQSLRPFRHALKRTKLEREVFHLLYSGPDSYPEHAAKVYDPSDRGRIFNCPEKWLICRGMESTFK